MKKIITMDIYPGGGVEVVGVRDALGHQLSIAECKKATLEAATAMGKPDLATLKSIPPKVQLKQTVKSGAR